MREGTESPEAVEYADGDYGYDLVHETLGDTGAAPEPPPVAPAHFEPVPGDSDGDYGYDLAHDMREP